MALENLYILNRIAASYSLKLKESNLSGNLKLVLSVPKTCNIFDVINEIKEKVPVAEVSSNEDSLTVIIKSDKTEEDHINYGIIQTKQLPHQSKVDVFEQTVDKEGDE